MVVKEYIKGKKLTVLEKIRDKLEQTIDYPHNYYFRYKVSYNVSLEITPTGSNTNIEVIKQDLLKFQEYLIDNKIEFSLTWWGKFIKMSVKDY